MLSNNGLGKFAQIQFNYKGSCIHNVRLGLGSVCFGEWILRKKKHGYVAVAVCTFVCAPKQGFCTLCRLRKFICWKRDTFVAICNRSIECGLQRNINAVCLYHNLKVHLTQIPECRQGYHHVAVSAMWNLTGVCFCRPVQQKLMLPWFLLSPSFQIQKYNWELIYYPTICLTMDL